MTIGERIRFYRKDRALTQKELGALSKTSETTIKQYELGKRQPRIEQLEAIATALGVATSTLLGVAIIEEDELYVDNAHMSEARQQAHRKIDCLNERGVEKALILIDTVYVEPEYNDNIRQPDVDE